MRRCWHHETALKRAYECVSPLKGCSPVSSGTATERSRLGAYRLVASAMAVPSSSAVGASCMSLRKSAQLLMVPAGGWELLPLPPGGPSAALKRSLRVPACSVRWRARLLYASMASDTLQAGRHAAAWAHKGYGPLLAVDAAVPACDIPRWHNKPADAGVQLLGIACYEGQLCVCRTNLLHFTNASGLLQGAGKLLGTIQIPSVIASSSFRAAH